MTLPLLGRLGRLLAEDASHLPVLTGIRGCAALWVYLYHVWGHSGRPEFVLALGGFRLDLTPLVSLGGAGVTIFFVLSGFLLSLPFAEWQAGWRERPALGRYLFRRLARVFPAYYAQLAILVAIAVVLAGPGAMPDGPTLLRHLAMLFVPPPLGTTPINLVWWTLPIEFSFYLLLPLLALLLRPGRWWLLLAGSLLAMWLWRHTIILRLAEAPIQLRVYSSYQLAGSFDMFGLGMLAALIHVHRQRLPAALARLLRHDGLVLLGLALLTAAVYWLAGNRQYYWADYPIYYLWTPLLSLGTVALILAGAGGSRLAALLFGNRPIVFAGLVSYSFYLWHLPVLDWVAGAAWLQPLAGRGFAGLLAVSLAAAMLVSTLSYLAVERPGMRLRGPRAPAPESKGQA